MQDPATNPRIEFSDSFVEARGCKRWLESVPLTNLHRAAEAICLQLDRLRAAPIPAIERLRIAEVLREPAMFLHGELAKRYAGKPLPHVDRELEAAEDAIRLWQSLWALYSQCLKALFDGDHTLPSQPSRLLQRALFVGKQLVLTHGLARRLLPPAFWSELHAFYRFAEILNCTTVAVDDPYIADTEGVSCYSTYSHGLLALLADPYALTVREIELVDRWLAMWGRKVHPVPGPVAADAPLLAVDLDGSGGYAVIPMSPASPSPTLRFGQTAKLAQSVGGRVKKLANGATPAELKLGDDCKVESSVRLLKHLYARWCLAPRRYVQDAVENQVRLCAGGLPAAYFRLTGRTLRSEEPRDRFTFSAAQRFATLDAVQGYDPRRDLAEREWPWEHWQGVLSGSDATLRRAERTAHRWHLDQLVLCGADDSVRPGYVTWIAEERGEEGRRALSARVALWSGQVDPLALRQVDELLKNDPPFAALRITSSLDGGNSLVLPPRAWAPGRRLRAADGEQRGFVLGKLLQRGADFDRVSFEPD